jgi:hypothetical protein
MKLCGLKWSHHQMPSVEYFYMKKYSVKGLYDKLMERAKRCCCTSDIIDVMKCAHETLWGNSSWKSDSEAALRSEGSSKSMMKCAAETLGIITNPESSLDTISSHLENLAYHRKNQPCTSEIVSFVASTACFYHHMVWLQSVCNVSYGKNCEDSLRCDLDRVYDGELRWQVRVEREMPPCVRTKPKRGPTMVLRSSKRSRPMEGDSWVVRGIVDTMLPNGEIIEVKHRTQNLKKSPSDAELVQVHVYMFALSLRSAQLMQCIREDPKRSISISTFIPFSDTFWTSVLRSVKKILAVVEEVKRSAALQLALGLLHDAGAMEFARTRLGELKTVDM